MLGERELSRDSYKEMASTAGLTSLQRAPTLFRSRAHFGDRIRPLSKDYECLDRRASIENDHNLQLTR